MQEKALVGSDPDWVGLENNRVRPIGKPAMFQTWNDLVFLHSRVPAQILQKLIPPEFTVEEFHCTGWLGFVPFSMSGIRPTALPALPWLSNFHETNLRTYVTHPEYGPGVWFFSLEATRYLGCLIARMVFKLPYFHASLLGGREGDVYRYQGSRNRNQVLPNLNIQTAKLDHYSVHLTRTGDWFNANPETFEYWLVERYRLYSKAANGRVMTAKVFHEPYEIANANACELQLVGLESQLGNLDFSSILVAKTLQVECFSPERV